MKTTADILAKAAAIKATPQFFAKVRKAKAMKKTKPAAAVKRVEPPKDMKPLPPPIESDNGDRLMAARSAWSDTMATAHRLSRHGSRNITVDEQRFLEAARELPRKAPNANSTLREWRHFTQRVEELLPTIKERRTF